MPHAVEQSAGLFAGRAVVLPQARTPPVPRPLPDAGRPAVVDTVRPVDSSATADGFLVVAVDDPLAWEALGADHPLRSIFCSWGWGAYKQATGWHVRRLRIDLPSGEPFALCSVSERRRLGARLLHIQGGPLVLGCERVEPVARALEAVVAHLRPGPFDVVMVHTYAFRTDCLLLALLASGFAPVTSRADFTLMVDLTRGLDPIREAMSRRWRRSLKHAAARLEARFPVDRAGRLAAMQRFEPMYRRLAERKRFEVRTSVGELASIVADDSRYVVLEVLDGSEVVAIRIAHVAGDLLTEFLAATSERALESHAGYFAMWSMIERASSLGLARVDAGGVDPFGSPGVFQFKRGIAREVRASGPIWLWSRSRLVRNALQAYMTWS